MFKTLKMDLYRLFRSKGLLVTLIIFFGMTFLSAYFECDERAYFMENQDTCTTYVYDEASDDYVEILAKDSDEPLYSEDKLSNFFLFGEIMSNNLSTITFAAIFSLIFASAEISTGFIKNLANYKGFRVYTVFSKSIISVIISILLILTGIISASIGSMIWLGYIHFDTSELFNHFCYYAVWSILAGIFCMVVNLIYLLTKNIAITMALAVLSTVNLLEFIARGIEGYFKLSNEPLQNSLLTFQMNSLSFAPDISFIYAAVVGGAYLVVIGIISVILMKNKDIR